MTASCDREEEQERRQVAQYLSDNPSEDTRGLDFDYPLDTAWRQRVEFEKRVRWVRFMLWTGVSALTPSLRVMLTSWH